MELLRRNLFWIVCGVVTLAGVALGVTGLRAMPDVVKQMEASTSLYKSLQSMQSSPVNQAALDAETRRVDSIQADYRKVLERAEQLYHWSPLLAEGQTQAEFIKACMSDPAEIRESADEKERASACTDKWHDKIGFPEGQPLQFMDFRRKYAEAMNQLVNRLHPGEVPTAADLAAMKERRENELAEQKQKGGAATAAAATDAKTVAGVLTEMGVRDDPAARAAIAKALSFWTYAINFNEGRPQDPVASLQFRDQMRETGTVEAPQPFDVWMAQVHYWIQKDVIDAIVEINEAAAKEAKEGGKPAWVGTMAVKDLISIRLSEYVEAQPDRGLVQVAAPGDYAAGLPPASAETVFTGTASGPDYDVIQFTVKAVMDQRDIPLLVEKIWYNRFHTLVRVAYTAVPPNRDLKGKIYGSEPAVNVVLDFETVMLGEVFRSLMPQEVCDFFKIPCPKREAKP